MIQLQGKYNRLSRYYSVRVQRAALRSLIRPLASWRPMKNLEDGYSVILGCTHRLPGLLNTNLLMLSRQDLTHLFELLVVVDTSAGDVPVTFERELRERYPELPLRFLYYSPTQVRITGMIQWAWVYSWLSWCIGIGATRTRYAVLHDFDAMLVQPEMLRRRFERMLLEPIDFLGVRYYNGNGVSASDELVTTFEMMFDCAFVRHHFKPLDLFNHVCRWRGRTVDFDTFLYAQSRLGRTAVLPLQDCDMVHPSQMICQFTELMSGRELNPTRSSLLLIPYFMSVGGADEMMAGISDQLARNGNGTIDFFGRPIRPDRLNLTHAQWLASQAERLDNAVFGEVREDVRSYFELLCERACVDEPAIANAR